MAPSATFLALCVAVACAEPIDVDFAGWGGRSRDRAATADDTEWAAGMQRVRMGEDGVDGEVLPYITAGASEAHLLKDPSESDMQALRHLTWHVLSNQVVLVSGIPGELVPRLPKGDANKLAATRNELASELACTDVFGTAIFMLVARQPVAGQHDLHELAFFTDDLWEDFVKYMSQARRNADFFGGPEVGWTLKIHWNVLPIEQRLPFVLSTPQLSVVALPKLETSCVAGETCLN